MKEFSSGHSSETGANKSTSKSSEVSTTKSSLNTSELGIGAFNGTEVKSNSITSTELRAANSPEALAQAQIENVHATTMLHLLENDAQYFTKEDLARLTDGINSIELLDTAKNPGKGGSYLFSHGESSMKVASINEWQRERSTIHETHHFASHNKEVIVPDKNGYWVHKTVGTRESSYFHSNRNGENYGFSEQGRGLNEGITVMLTNEYITELSPERGRYAEQQQIYGQAVDLTTSLKEIVGDAAIKEAYFGGNMQPLQEKVNELAGDKKAFEKLRAAMDKTISRDATERAIATRRAHEILAQMSEGGMN